MEKLQLKTNSDNAGSENTTEVNEEMNKEVRDMIDLGLLDKNWAEGLSKVEAEIKLSQILSNDQSFKHSQAAPFANEDMNKEVSDMIDLGLLDKNWAEGLSKVEAEIKLSQILSNDQSFKHSQAAPFANEDMNKEVSDMIDLGLLDKKWAEGLSKVEAEIKLSQILSNDQSFKHSQAAPFANEDMNKEVSDMIDIGLLDKNWAEGLSKVEAEIKLSQILSNDQSFKHSQAAPFANEDMNKEVSDMIDLGLLDKYWADGLSKVEAEIKFNKVLNGQLSSTSIETSQFPVNKSSTPARKKNLPRIKNYKLIPLSSEDQIFKDIFAYFKSCRIERKINAIQRVENEKQKKLFEEETNQLERLHGKEFDMHIQDLYHGSNAARNLICSRGLDQRLGQVGLFGKGIYFSDNLKKCEKYLTNNKGSAIYKCSVILGDIKEYPSGVAAPELKQEPEKENGDYYDSVKGNFDGYNEYIIYDNRRCLIKYRIVLEGTEDEDSDIEVMVAKQEAEDNMMETWKRHMHYLVNTCRHENEEDAKTEQEIRNIEKIRLEIRRRREIQTGEPLTEVTYDMLRKERKTWKKYVNKAETNKMPSQQKSDREKSHSIATGQHSNPENASQQKSDHEKSHSIATGQHSNPENASQQKSDHEKSHSIATGQHSNPDILTDSKDDYMQLIFDKTLSEFVEVTHCEDTELARNIILNQNWNLDEAINEYFTLML